ncbi:hypothetical protein O3P69_015456 [Scylla paramamosain]|uniref:LicD/FKTN/FKRP nucleotidyltransferase domain-containing protein n=1 Tax=Scylla paramamosain TaxID=85552 RepID=A0AAW0T6S5_SCYPA
MGRHAAIQTFLLTLTGCSWMLLFLTITLSDHHVFREYQAASKVAARIHPPEEPDPCEACWGTDEDEGHTARSDESSTTQEPGWGVRLARAIGVGKNAEEATDEGGKGGVSGVSAFYYYTLHTTFTALRLRLKKAQQVAGDVRDEVAALEEKVTHLHRALVTHFSPRHNPYSHKSSHAKRSGQDPKRRVSLDLGSDQRKHAPPASNPPERPQRSREARSDDVTTRGASQGSQKPVVPQGSHNRVFPIVAIAPSTPAAAGETTERLKAWAQLQYRVVCRVTVRVSKERVPRYWTRQGLGRGRVVIGEWVGRRVLSVGAQSRGVPKHHTAVRSVVSVIVVDGDPGAELLAALGSTYPGMTVHLVTTTPSSHLQTSHIRLSVHSVQANTTTGAAYRQVLRHVRTPYVLVAQGGASLSRVGGLGMLVWAVEHLGVWAAGGGLLSPSGLWRPGCLTTSYAHYEAAWERGHLGTAGGCLLCQALEGPFLAVTAALRHFGWDAQLPTHAAHLDLFLRAAHSRHMLAASCSGSLFSLSGELESPSRDSLLSLARHHSLYSLQLPQSSPVLFSCKEVKAKCGNPGLALPPCCRQELARLVRFTLDMCEAHNLLCELQEGSLLGALKVGGVMPWERDADLTFHTKNYTALEALKDVFERAGYSLHLTDNRWCCVDGRWAGGQGSLSSEMWRAELWSQHAMDSEENLLAGRPRTRVEFDGSWVAAPSSPGQYVRNRYGTEVYRHAQHWLDTGRSSGWEEYESGKFLPCSDPTHHACLDQYLPDGNLRLHPLCVTTSATRSNSKNQITLSSGVHPCVSDAGRRLYRHPTPTDLIATCRRGCRACWHRGRMFPSRVRLQAAEGLRTECCCSRVRRQNLITIARIVVSSRQGTRWHWGCNGGALFRKHQHDSLRTAAVPTAISGPSVRRATSEPSAMTSRRAIPNSSLPPHDGLYLSDHHHHHHPPPPPPPPPPTYISPQQWVACVRRRVEDEGYAGYCWVVDPAQRRAGGEGRESQMHREVEGEREGEEGGSRRQAVSTEGMIAGAVRETERESREASQPQGSENGGVFGLSRERRGVMVGLPGRGRVGEGGEGGREGGHHLIPETPLTPLSPWRRRDHLQDHSASLSRQRHVEGRVGRHAGEEPCSGPGTVKKANIGWYWREVCMQEWGPDAECGRGSLSAAEFQLKFAIITRGPADRRRPPPLGHSRHSHYD